MATRFCSTALEQLQPHIRHRADLQHIEVKGERSAPVNYTARQEVRIAQHAGTHSAHLQHACMAPVLSLLPSVLAHVEQPNGLD